MLLSEDTAHVTPAARFAPAADRRTPVAARACARAAAPARDTRTAALGTLAAAAAARATPSPAVSPPNPVSSGHPVHLQPSHGR